MAFWLLRLRQRHFRKEEGRNGETISCECFALSLSPHFTQCKSFQVLSDSHQNRLCSPPERSRPGYSNFGRQISRRIYFVGEISITENPVSNIKKRGRPTCQREKERKRFVNGSLPKKEEGREGGDGLSERKREKGTLYSSHF